MFKQQVRSQILFSFLISAAIPIVCSAQSLNDGYEFRESGVYHQVASLQNAVYRRDGAAPVYGYDDTTGKQTCIWNCDHQGETGVARKQEVRVMGRDSRNDATSFFNSEQADKFSNAGRIECPMSGNRTFNSTGWITTGPDTMATSAHSFVNPETNARISPSTCVFVMYDRSGRELDRIGIRYANSRWDTQSHFLDASYELAAVKLERQPRHPIQAPTTGVAIGLNNRPVKLVAFHGDVSSKTTIRITDGILYSMPPGSQPVAPGNGRASDTSRLFITDYDSNHGSSGGMVIDDETGAIIGLHVGSNDGGQSGEFNKAKNYNYGIYFDEAFIAQLRSVAADKSSGRSI